MQDALFVRVRGRIPSVLFAVRSLSFEVDSSFSQQRIIHVFVFCWCLIPPTFVLFHTISFSVNSSTTFISLHDDGILGQNLRNYVFKYLQSRRNEDFNLHISGQKKLKQGQLSYPNFLPKIPASFALFSYASRSQNTVGFKLFAFEL